MNKLTTRQSNKLFALTLILAMVIMTFMPGVTYAWSFTDNPFDTGNVKLYFGDPAYDPVPPESLMQFDETSTLTYHAVYTGADSANYYPDRLLLVIEPNSGTLTINGMTGTNVTVTQPPSTTGVYDMSIAKTSSTKKVEFNATAGGGSQAITITFDEPKDIKTGDSNLYAYLPAPAQFVNEGMGSGGWGDAYSSAGDLKFGGDPTGTGVSLGSFGGYTVFDFGSTGISNDPNNKYGADFIVYGNAFWGNSEAGAVQVAPDANEDGEPDAWYNIAGSDYYKDDVERDYKVTYADPNPEANTLASVPYTAKDATSDGSPQTWTGNGLVNKNTFHNHSWYPLAVNYFANRLINSKTCQPVDRIDDLDFVKRVPIVSGVGVDVTYTDSTSITVDDTSLLYFDGVKYVTSGTTTGNSQFVFGYCDIHPNRSSNFDTAYNPYSLDGVSSSGDYNTATTGTGGGDPIDISWAVDEAGEPVDLDSIRFVRVYTGVQQMNGIFGEISTEVLGVKENTETGTGSAAEPSIKVTIEDEYGETTYDLVDLVTDGTIQNMGTVEITALGESSMTIFVNSGEDHVYMNNIYGSSQNISGIPASGYKDVRAIVQDGDGSPYVILLKIAQ